MLFVFICQSFVCRVSLIFREVRRGCNWITKPINNATSSKNESLNIGNVRTELLKVYVIQKFGMREFFFGLQLKKISSLLRIYFVTISQSLNNIQHNCI